MGLNSVKSVGNAALSSTSLRSTSVRESVRDLNHDFERLLALVCGVVSEFALYDTSKIAVSVSRSRRNGRVGTLAYVVPLRYVGGAKERKGRRWGVAGTYSYESAQLDREQPGAMYIMTFLVPKFFSLKARDRLDTLVHELYHLHPTMRGDLRRFAAPHLHHGPTPAAYNRKVKALSEEALAAIPNLLEHPLLARDESQIGDFRAKRFNIPRHVFKPKPFGWFLATALFCLLATPAFAQRVPVIIIKNGAMRVAPQASAGTEMTVKRGDRFEAFRLSQDRQWVWVGNSQVRGWVHREHVQSQNLDRQLGIRGAYVDPRVPNKLGETKVKDKESSGDDVQENGPGLQARRSSVPNDGKTLDEAFDDEISALPSGPSLDEIFDAESSSSAPPATSVGEAPTKDIPLVAGLGAGGGTLDDRGDLEEAPTTEQTKDLKLSPEEQSHLEEGEKVSKAQIRAQTRLSPIRRNDFRFRNDGGAASTDGALVTWEETFNADTDRATIMTGGKLFERPSEQARRYGILQDGDEVIPLAHTDNGLWLRVRLQETGEEGWFPAKSIRVRQADRMQDVIYRHALEGHGGWGTRGHGFGGGVGYHFGLSYDEKYRFWSVGLDFSYWLGERLALASSVYSSKYFGVAALARYNIPSSSSNFVAAVEGGLGYYQGIISTGGLTEETIVQNGLTAQSSRKLVPVFGGIVKYGIMKRLDIFAQARFQLSSTSQVYAAMGLGGKF